MGDSQRLMLQRGSLVVSEAKLFLTAAESERSKASILIDCGV